MTYIKAFNNFCVTILKEHVLDFIENQFKIVLKPLENIPQNGADFVNN